MDAFPLKLKAMLEKRKEEDLLRNLTCPVDLVDFSSNDYLGFARVSGSEYAENEKKDRAVQGSVGGSTGSRLISGNHPLYEEAEAVVADFHKSESALIFNSGYDANVGLLSSVLQRSDLVFYDEAVHASIRDGLRLSNARAYSFKHNDLEALEKKIAQVLGKGTYQGAEVYVITETVFSMGGDSPELELLTEFCRQRGYRLILDEAHAAGVLGPEGRGLAVEGNLQEFAFARIVTFGKAFGAHGAAVLGSKDLRTFLINFSRSLIYTTALPPASLLHILCAYKHLQGPEGIKARELLFRNFKRFTAIADELEIGHLFPKVGSAIRSCQVGSSSEAIQISAHLAKAGYDVRAMRPPTVPEGSQCLRFCLHSFNTEPEIREVLTTLASALKEQYHA